MDKEVIKKLKRRFCLNNDSSKVGKDNCMSCKSINEIINSNTSHNSDFKKDGRTRELSCPYDSAVDCYDKSKCKGCRFYPS